MKKLLFEGADPNIGNTAGQTPLHVSMRTETTALLIGAGANVNAITITGATPLYDAASSGLADKVRLLLGDGADVQAGPAGRTPFLAAVMTHLAYSSTTMGRSERANETEAILRMLVAAGAAVDVVDDAGISPIHLAARAGDTDAVALLIAFGADIEAIDGKGHTAIQSATMRSQGDVVQQLIQAGADINSKDGRGASPLHNAVHRNDVELVRTLINSGANLEATVSLSQTPLHWAAMLGRSEIANLLVVAGANVNARTDRGDTPISYASRKGFNDIVVMLERAVAR